jgi:glycine/D-amino acid oxidase-like deaminating enzyme
VSRGHVVVIGGGAAGAAAAIVAARAGARTTVVDGGTGASTLWTGAAHATDAVSPEARDVAAALGVTVAPSTLVATSAHAAAHGHDAALLNLSPLISSRVAIAVVGCDRPQWDAELVARWDGEALFPLEATMLRHVDERALPDADFAARHDDPGRLGWLADRLREALARSERKAGALLLPPSLGVERSRAEELSKRVGIPCGEAIGLPGGPPGLRFESARNRALQSAGVDVVHGRASRVDSTGGKWRVTIAGNGDAGLEADAVVVAAGGLVGGGLEYQSSEWILAAALPPYSRAPFRCTIDGPLPLGAHGRPLELPGSLYGMPPESIAWPFVTDPLMSRVGVLTASDGRVVQGLYVAGELVADLPRTWLDALESGIRAGVAAARELLTATSPQSASASAASATRP